MLETLKKVQLGNQSALVKVPSTKLPMMIEMDDKTKIKLLEQRVSSLETAVRLLHDKTKNQTDNAYAYKKVIAKRSNVSNKNTNKDGIPTNTCLVGVSRNVSYFLYVEKNSYRVGENRYATLSAAAEAVSGCRRSGWTFWKTISGQDTKTFYNKK